MSSAALAPTLVYDAVTGLKAFFRVKRRPPPSEKQVEEVVRLVLSGGPGGFHCEEFYDCFNIDALYAAADRRLVKVIEPLGTSPSSVHMTREGYLYLGLQPPPTLMEKIRPILSNLIARLR